MTRLYGLPKIYKKQHGLAPHSFRLWHNNIQHSQSQNHHKPLQNYCGKTSSFFKDFIQKIENLPINPEEETLVSFDVSAFFTSIPVPVALQVVSSKFFTCINFTNVYKFPTEKFIKLLEFTISNCIFCLNKKFYKQLQGVAMDLPVSPSLQISTCHTLNTEQFLLLQH